MNIPSQVRKSVFSLLGLAALVSASAVAETEAKPEIGVLLASHGDIDTMGPELDNYIKTAFLKNVGIPFPYWLRPLIKDFAFKKSIGRTREQYSLILPTRYKAGAEAQVAAVTEELKKMGVNGKAYFGANFTNPLVEETLEKMQKDGIKKFIVINKGAQFSWASAGENITDVRDYLKKHPEWDVEAIGLHQYNYDMRFREAWASSIERDALASFPTLAKQDICLLVASHGLPLVMTNAGDPAVNMMNDSVAWLRTRLPEFKLYQGFLNDDGDSGEDKWVSPKATLTAEQMRKDGCKNILMDARLSFTNHHRATLFDLDIEVRNILEQPKLDANGQVDSSWEKPNVVLARQFDADEEHARALAEIAMDAFDGQGDFEKIKDLGGSVLPRPNYPVPSKYIIP